MPDKIYTRGELEKEFDKKIQEVLIDRFARYAENKSPIMSLDKIELYPDGINLIKKEIREFLNFAIDEILRARDAAWLEEIKKIDKKQREAGDEFYKKLIKTFNGDNPHPLTNNL